MKTLTLFMAIIAILAVVASGIFFKMFAENAEATKNELIKEQARSKKLIKSIDELEKVRKDLEKEEEQANRTLASSKGKLGKAEEKLKDVQKKLEKEQALFEDFSKNKASKKSELARLDKDFDTLKKELESPALGLNNLDSQITKMEVEIDDLDDQLKIRDEEIAELATEKNELQELYAKLNTEKLEMIASFDSTPIDLRLESFDANWGIATLTAKKIKGLKVGDVLAVDLGIGDSLGIKKSFILRVSAIDKNNVVAQFVSEEPELAQSLLIGQKASLIKI